MTRHLQQTLASKVSFIGKGLHSGRFVRMEIFPAGADVGIVFERTDTPYPIRIRAIHTNIIDSALCTAIGSGSSSISTIEHLCAAFAGLQIDNALIRLNGPEVPILDGSAMPFIEKFQMVGVKKLQCRRRMLLITKKIEIREGDRYIRAEPGSFCEILCSIEYNNSLIGAQKIQYEHGGKNFMSIAAARTFCHLRDVNALRSQGLALGGSLDNAIVVDSERILNEGGLRFTDEFVRHKLLDLLGDLYLCGGQIVGRIEAHKPGHEIQAHFVKELHARRLLVEIEVGAIMEKVLRTDQAPVAQVVAIN